MYFLAGFLIVLLVIIVIFAFPQFSPIPYFPSNGKDIPLILSTLNIRTNQVVIDLGAGDGVVILRAAERAFKKKLNTKFIAVEINPVLLLVLHIRRLLHPNRNNIIIMSVNMFTCDYSAFRLSAFDFMTFYIYISPWFIEKTVNNISTQVKKFDLVSYFYQVKNLQKHKETIQEGVHEIFSYRS